MELNPFFACMIYSPISQLQKFTVENAGIDSRKLLARDFSDILTLHLLVGPHRGRR